MRPDELSVTERAVADAFSSGTQVDVLTYETLTYESRADADERADRLRWLRLDPDGFRPRAYTQLAEHYRAAGRDDDARTVLLSGERHRREVLGPPGRWWGTSRT